MVPLGLVIVQCNVLFRSVCEAAGSSAVGILIDRYGDGRCGRSLGDEAANAFTIRRRGQLCGFRMPARAILRAPAGRNSRTSRFQRDFCEIASRGILNISRVPP